MTIVNVTLKGDLEKIVEDYIKSGRATSKTEVIRMGLQRLLPMNQPAEKKMPETGEIGKMGYDEWKKGFEALASEMACMNDEEVEKSIIEAQKKRHRKWSDVP